MCDYDYCLSVLVPEGKEEVVQFLLGLGVEIT